MDQETKALEQQKLITVALLMIAAVAAAVALIYTRSLMVPFVLAFLFSFLVEPLVELLQRRGRIPRWGAVIAAFFVIAGSFAALVALIASSVSGLEENAALYRERLLLFAQRVTVWLNSLGIDMGQESLIAALKKLPILQWAKQAAGGIVDLLSDIFLVTLFTIYLVTGRRDRSAKSGIVAEINDKIRRYLVTKICTSAATGTLVALILWVIGVELAFVFGLMAFLLNFIPNIGSVLATALPLPVALVQFQSPLPIVATLIFPGAVQMVVGNVVEPKLMGEGMDLHPITILLMLMFWGLIWGVVGMLLATPITAVLKLIFARFVTTRPVAELLAGRIGVASEPTF